MRVKIEHIDNLRRWKKSWSKIGSRWVPHHLYKYEEVKYQRALRYKYLEITQKERVNLSNLWQKVCLVKWWKNLILVKDTEQWISEILKDGISIETGNTKDLKQLIKSYV